MARKSVPPAPVIEPKIFNNVDEINRAITKLERRINEISQIDFEQALIAHTGADDVAENNLRDTILEIYGPHSPEYDAHKHIEIWAGPMYMPMSDRDKIGAKTAGRVQTIGIINGLITRLKEKREDLEAGETAAPSTYFEKLNLHPRIGDVTRELFLDGHHFEAVFAGAKALINYVKERSGRHDLDGAPLMRTETIPCSPLTTSATKPIKISRKDSCICLKEPYSVSAIRAATHSRRAPNNAQSNTSPF
jgi:hypothetical protein